MSKSTVDKIYNFIKTYFITTGFLVTDDSVQTISGSDEGFYTWVTANYLKGNLQSVLIYFYSKIIFITLFIRKKLGNSSNQRNY